MRRPLPLLCLLALSLSFVQTADAFFNFRQGGQQQQQQQRQRNKAKEVDYYAALGLHKSTATSHAIRKAYRKLSKDLHPDKNKDKPEGEREATKKRFVDVSTAYEVLSDADKKRIYDSYGVEGLEQEQGRAAQRRAPQNDIFSQFFGGGGGGNQNGGEKRGASIKLPLLVDLADVYSGAEFEVAHKKQTLCHHCRGSGANDPDDVKTCPKCRGAGQITVTQQMAPGFVSQTQRPCDRCEGKGQIMTSKCPHCKGRKVEMGEESFFVLVEKGMKEGHEIVFEREGDERPDEIPGDITYTVQTVPHRRFTRERNDVDLRVRLTLSLLDALVGFTKTFKHLDGHDVVVSRDAVSRPGDVITVAGEGMPVFGAQDAFGNLFVDISIQMPAALSEAQKDLARKIWAERSRVYESQ
jgi:DnaJ-related protein SCJ1